MKDFEMSLQSAQGSLLHLTEQKSLDEISEHGKFPEWCWKIKFLQIVQFQTSIRQNLTKEVWLLKRWLLEVTPQLRQMC